MKKTLLNGRLSSISTLALALFLSGPAFAQSQETPLPDEHPSAGADIVVTGSRIARPELDSAMPIGIIHLEDAASAGRFSAYDALTLSPSIGIGQSLASGSTGWDAGTQSVNMRGLGVNRTLTLIDGQRRVSSSARSSAVDLGMIPVAMIERIEVVTGGAAAVYGADAVSGAVNIITKRHIDGINITATNGISSRGDAGEFIASLSTGGKFGNDRGSFAIGATYSQTDPLVYTDRWPQDYYNRIVNNPENTGPNDGIPDMIYIEKFRQAYYGYVPNFWMNDKNWVYDNGVVREAICDPQYTPGSRAYCGGGDGRNEYDREQLQGGQKSLAVMGRVDYELTDNINFNTYFSYARQKYKGTSTLWRDDERPTFFNGGGGSIAYLDNPYLPDPIREFMVSNDLTQMNINRTYGNFPIRGIEHDRKTLTVGQSIGGKLTDRLNWSAFWQYGRSANNVVESNIPYRSHWLAARDVVADGNGNPVCRDTAARAEGCIPLNFFSLEQPSAELLNYVMANRHERRVNTQQVYGANMSGSLFSLPYGDLSIALGVEHRKETLKTRDDPLALSGELVYAYGGTAHPELDVSSKVSEVFGEIVVPILKDIPFINSLEVEGAYRYSKYDRFDTHAWKGGATWAPFDWIMFRGVRSRSVRAPNFGELYEPQTVTPTGTFTDPCSTTQYNLSPTRAANCIALGITTPLPAPSYVGPFVTTGGNPDLRPETSNSLTLGVVIQPKFLRGFDLTVDYWDVDINDVITTFGTGTILPRCVDLPSIDNIFCKAITRDPVTKNADAVFAGTLNASRLYSRGIDIGASHRLSLGSGQLNLSFKGTYLLKQVTETTPGIASGNVKHHGDINYPRFRATLLTSYTINDFNIALNTRFIGAAKISNTVSDEYYENDHLPHRIYNDLSIGYNINEKYNLRIGVENMFDTKAPLRGYTYTNTGTYGIIGRYFNITAGVKF